MRFFVPVFSMGLLLLVAACGGGGGGNGGDNGGDAGDGGSDGGGTTINFSIGGTAQGLNGTVQLTNNGADTLTLNANGAFFFSQALPAGASYAAAVAQQPQGQSCVLSNGSGTVADANVTNIVLACLTEPVVQETFAVSGTTTGLTGKLVLGLNTTSSQEKLSVTGPAFSFQQRLAEGVSYAIEILQQPAGQTCVAGNGSGVVTTEGVPAVSIVCESLSTALVTISGKVGVASNTVADSDLNDPASAFISNSSFSQAQAIENLVTLQGFVTEVPTSNFATFFDDRSGDRFYRFADVDDYFRVSLQAGQVIQLQVIDYESFQTESPFTGDLDLYLYNASENLIDISDSETEFESLVVPATGDYYVNVYAFSGASKYVLKISSGNASSVSATGGSADTSMGNFVPNQAVVKFADAVLPYAIAQDNSVTFTHRDPDRATLASFQNTHAASTASAADSIAAMAELAALNPASYEKTMTLRRIKAMRQMAGVEYAEPNYLRYPLKVPNDSYYNLQWHYPAINLPQAWDISTGTPVTGDVIVAVIDTGVVLNHPDLKNQLIAGYDFIASDDNSGDNESGIDSNADDTGDGGALGSSSWHGTHVAGTVAAETNNGSGVAGVSWGAKIMPLRALGKEGGTTYDIMQSLRYAAGLSNDSGTLPAQKADVINLSLGGPGESQAEGALYRQVHDLGIIIVAAAGNENTSELSYPASYDGVISVSALDFNDERAPYSNFGSTVDIAAPGGDTSADRNGDGQPDGIMSTLVDDSSGSRQPVLAFYQGTSMASPHVAGVFALMKAVYPALTSTEVDSLLQSGALTNEAGNPGRDDIYGFGVVDALRAVQAAQALAGGANPPALPASIVATPASLTLAGSSTSTLLLSNKGGGNPLVTGVAASESWLSVSAAQTDSTGLGSYQVSANASGLSDGFHLAKISFTFDSAPAIVVRVSMTVGQLQTGGDLAEIYILLYDPESQSSTINTRGTRDASGDINFSLVGVPAGTYLVYAGTDVDNDGFICQAGEGCGIWPSIGQAVPVKVNGENINGIDFIADILAGFGNLDSLAAGAEKATVAGIPRLKPSKKLPAPRAEDEGS
jgi:serine protease